MSASSTGVRQAARREEQTRIWLEVLAMLIATRAALAVVASLSSLVLRKGRSFGTPKTLADLFFRWDSSWYEGIVQNGYSYTPGVPSNVAFFPLYPLLVRVLAILPGHHRFYGFLLSNLALLAAGVGLYKLVLRERSDRALASRAVLHMMLWPTSFFFSIFYTEGLFLCLAVWTLYLTCERRFVAAGLCGALLTATRPTGLLICLPLVVELLGINFGSLRPKFARLRRDALALVLVPAGIVAYMAFLHFEFGDALAFQHAAAAEGWNRRLVWITTSLENSRRYGAFYRYLFYGTAAYAVILVAALAVLRVRISLVLYAALSVFFALSWNYLEAVPRYISVAFPLYLGSALLAGKFPVLDHFLTTASAMLLALCTILFVLGYWFT